MFTSGGVGGIIGSVLLVLVGAIIGGYIGANATDYDPAHTGGVYDPGIIGVYAAAIFFGVFGAIVGGVVGFVLGSVIPALIVAIKHATQGNYIPLGILFALMIIVPFACNSYLASYRTEREHEAQATANPAPTATPGPLLAMQATLEAGIVKPRSTPHRAYRAYTHSTGAFALNVPDGWKATELNPPGSAVALFGDDSYARYAVVLLRVTEQPLDTAWLDAELHAAIEEFYGDRDDLYIEEPPEDSNPIRTRWHRWRSFSSTDSHGRYSSGSGYIRHDGNSISIVLVADVRRTHSPNFLIDSYYIDSTPNLPDP
jgi:hypothetical protein